MTVLAIGAIFISGATLLAVTLLDNMQSRNRKLPLAIF